MKKQKNRKNYRTALCVLYAASASLLGGCGLMDGSFSLALEEAPCQEDRLAGFFITDQYITSGMPKLTLNSRGELTAIEQDARKYGTLNTDSGRPPVTFDGLEGCGIYNLQLPGEESSNSVFADDAFTDMHFTVTDQENNAEASLYVSSDRPGKYFFNPVYQQADGQIYLLPGSGISSDSFAEGCQYSQSISQSRSSGPTGREETWSFSFTVNVISAEPMETPKLLFLDSLHQVVGTLSEEQLDAIFQKDSSPLQLPPGTAYLILEQTGRTTDRVSRSFFDAGSEYLEYLDAEEDGLLYPRQLSLAWPEDDAS